MRPLAWVLVALVVLAVVAAVAWTAAQRRRRAALQDRFGPEYDRTVERTGDPRAADAHLADLARRRDRLEIRDLDPTSRARYDEQWDAVQSRFVDEPGQAVSDADGLVTAVMRERGYPVEDFEERVGMIAADHSDVVDHYRAAHDAHARHLQAGAADTEDLRRAFVHYRSLYAALTGRPTDSRLDRHDADRYGTEQYGTASYDDGRPSFGTDGRGDGRVADVRDLRDDDLRSGAHRTGDPRR